MKNGETSYNGQSAYVQINMEKFKKTGEVEIVGAPLIAENVVTKVNRTGFEITYLAYFLDLFDQLGGAKYKVFKYIIEHKESSNNTLIITINELIKKTETSRQTVVDTLKLLRAKGLIKTRVGSIMLLPKLSHRGSDRKEAYLMRKFESFEVEQEESPENNVAVEP